MSFNAPCTTRSRMDGIERWRTLPPSFGIPTFRGRWGRYRRCTSSSRSWYQLREELVQRRYRPQRPRKVGIPKEGGKVRHLSIPSIRDRVVQGALKLILEPIFEAGRFQRVQFPPRQGE